MSRSLAGSTDPGARRDLSARYILAFIAICAIEKAFACLATGFTGDEAYTLVIARSLALSYFDHPPLHQWILHGFVALSGESRWARAPFWLMFVAINAPLFGLTRRLFGAKAALWAMFAFNATTYFLVLPDGFIMPDAPSLLFLALAAWTIAEILFGPAEREGEAGQLWLAAGVALGCAGLAKYAALFVPIGLLGFLVGSPRHRHWLSDVRPYLGAVVALLIFSPALLWNDQNHWVSFSFQSTRAATALTFGADAWADVAAELGEQIVLLSPWIGAPIVLSMARAMRANADSGERFLLWLAAPPVVFFALLPLLGQRAIPHWFNSGWLFAFPLAGYWLSARSAGWLKNWGRAAAALAAATVVFYIAVVVVGLSRLIAFAPGGQDDPTQFSYDWRIANAAADFIVVDNWRVGGKVGVALGPKTPICAFTWDPREFAFACDSTAWLGKDADIIVFKEDAASERSAFAGYFERIDPGADFAVGRMGADERILTLMRAHNLLRSYPSPYGPAQAGP
jgi:4-amino-4-deoxy-L-arabinose transferase-like glycosyltransferase